LVATHIKNATIATNKEIAYKAVIVNYKRSLANTELYASQLYKDVKQAKLKTTVSQIALIALTIFTIIKL
jgi:uncharacterized protein (DUF1330 family)